MHMTHETTRGLTQILPLFVLILLLLPQTAPAQKIEWSSLGPEGGFLLCFAVAPGSPQVLYAGCDIYGGVYKSTDGGANWDFLGLVSGLGNTLDIKIHPVSSDIVYVACGKEGIYKSINGGQDWDLIFRRDDTVYSLGIDPESPDVIYAGLVIDAADDYGLYRSVNGGLTWPDSSFQGNAVLDICFDPDSSTILYAGTSYGVHQSTDGGSTWSFRGPPDASASIQSLVVADHLTWYAGSLSDERDAGTVYKTLDGGDTWEISYALGTPVYGLDIDRQNREILYMAAGASMDGQEGVFKTNNGGETWFPVNTGLTDRMARDVKVDPVTPNMVYAGTDGLGGVYKSTDGAATWHMITTGMRQTLVQAMDFDADHTLYAAVGWGTYRDIPCVFRRLDDGHSWIPLATVPSPYYMTSIWDIAADPDSSGLIYVSGMSHYSDTAKDPTIGLLYRSRDGGATWQTLWTPDNLWILCLAVDPVTKVIYAGTGGADPAQVYKIYRSTDRGDTWEMTSGWPSPGNPIFDIVIDPVSPDILYAGTGGAIFKSTDAGINWTPMASMPYAYTLLIDANAPNMIYAGSGGTFTDHGGVYRSTDSGTSWERVGLEDYPITSLTGVFHSRSIIYAGTGGKFLETNGNGIFRSTENGKTWEPVSNNLTSPFILSLKTDPRFPDRIYAGTMGRGLFQTADETGIEPERPFVSQPESFFLKNHPNPFNAVTTVTYHVPMTGRVILRIFNVSCRPVATLENALKKPGDYFIRWNGRDNAGNPVTSGLYICVLQAGALKETRKMLVIQ